MFRVLFILLFAVVAITLLRGVIGVLTKGLGAMLDPGKSPERRSGSVPLTGELKRDPVCGTFVSAATSIKQTSGSETLHFCSAECRSRYLASTTRV